MSDTRKELIAEVWRYLPFYQPGSPKIDGERVPVPVELLERVIKALADTAQTKVTIGGDPV